MTARSIRASRRSCHWRGQRVVDRLERLVPRRKLERVVEVRELAGLWSGRPFVIYGLRRDELRGWRIERDAVAELPLTSE